MSPAPNAFAILILLAVAAATGLAVAQWRDVKQGMFSVLGACALLAISLAIGLHQHSGSDVFRIFTLRSAVGPSFIEGYVWGEYGLLLGALAGTLSLRWRRHGRRHDA